MIAVGIVGAGLLEGLSEPWIMPALLAFFVVMFGLPLLIFGLK